jgi:hypothetical protein
LTEFTELAKFSEWAEFIEFIGAKWPFSTVNQGILAEKGPFLAYFSQGRKMAFSPT